MVKSASRVSAKSKKTKNSSLVLPTKQEKSPSKHELPSVAERELSEITVTIQNYQNIVPSYPSSFILAKCQYAGQELGETDKILMTDDSVILVEHDFKIKCDVECPKELDQLVANPLIIKLFQIPHVHSKLFIEDQMKLETDQLFLDNNVSPVESAISLYEALTGDTLEKIDSLSSSSEKKINARTKNDKKDKKGNKTNKKNKGSEGKLSKMSSKESKRSRKSDTTASLEKENSKELLKKNANQNFDIGKDKTEIGVSVLDLSPLLLDNSTFSEFVPIIPPETYHDDRMTRHLRKAGIYVTISIDKPLKFVCKPNLLNVTLESIYNIPAIMSEEMEYHACLVLPSVNLRQQPLLIKSGRYVITTARPERKQWSELPNEYFNETAYITNVDPDTIKNCVDKVNLSEALVCEKPRIQFNSVKRNVLLKEGFLALHDQIRKFRKVVLEIYAFKKRNEDDTKDSKVKTKNSSTGLNKEETNKKATSYIHLMAVVDVSPLLYPGITKLRIAVPITTFHKEEALDAGLEQSYFFPFEQKVHNQRDSKEELLKPEKKKSKSKIGKDNNSGKKSESSKQSKESQKSEGKDNTHEKEVEMNMNDKLPPEPISETIPKPSVKVYDEDGEPTFIILEFELTEPLVQKKHIDDLHCSLKELVQIKPKIPTINFNKELIGEFYHDLLKEIVDEMNTKYSTYTRTKNLCKCKKKADFLTYLKRCGFYQNLVFTVSHVACLVTQFRLNMVEMQQNFVKELFMHLMSETNQTLHKVTISSRGIVKIPRNFDSLLFYAKEATEIGNLSLAEKYYLERLHQNPNNPDFWFDYAIYESQCNEHEKAFLCLQEALTKNLYHRNSLLLSGILLTEKRRLKEAEMYFLTLMVHEPRWMEGWIVLYLFYKECENIGGMDLALEMARKYLNDPRFVLDYFLQTEDLAWTPRICPNTIYFNTSVMLLKMRMYSWVEKALTHELKETGLIHYMLAVICYYKKKYEHALEHLERARHFHGSDYAVVSLTGHCYLELGEHKKALEEYSHVLESFERPEDVHLLYINCAKIMTNPQARKLWLTACKHHPTPYTWLCCGIAYLEERDLISAEECFSESIILDNSIADCWGYLTLTNLKLTRPNEAELCYALALKNNLKNKSLQEEIEKEFEKLKPK